MRQRVLSWAFLALLVASVAAAQQGTTELRGRVIDAQGAVLPGVTVTVRNQETGMFRETVSGADGSFIASGLVPGTYQVSAELQGFKRFERRDQTLGHRQFVARGTRGLYELDELRDHALAVDHAGSFQKRRNHSRLAATACWRCPGSVNR